MATGFTHGPHLFVGTMPYSGDSRYTPEDIHKVVLSNLKAGVRYIDTAELYNNVLQYVGLAIKDSKLARNKLFISSKLKGLPIGPYELIEARLKAHLKRLNVNYLDLLLIHWPGLQEVNMSADPEKMNEKITWEIFDNNIDNAWENMILLKKAGLVKRIGVSNFYQQHLQRLLEYPSIEEEPPVANQIYLDATQHQMEFVEAMLKANIQVIAYRPLEFLPALKSAGEMGDSVYSALLELKDKASEPGNTYKSVEQFVLSWLFARGVHVCVKSSSSSHIRENMAALQKSKKFPEDIIEKFPEATELSTMVLAYDTYAQKFQSV